MVHLREEDRSRKAATINSIQDFFNIPSGSLYFDLNVMSSCVQSQLYQLLTL